jgi:ribonuclease HI
MHHVMTNVTIYAHAATLGSTSRSCCLLITDDRTRMEQNRVPGADANRTILQAAIHVLQSLSNTHLVEFFSVSNYLIQGMTCRLQGWKQRGWRTRSGKLLKNYDLWMQLDQLTQEHGVSWLYPRSHYEQRQMDKVTDQVYAPPQKRMQQQWAESLEEKSFGRSGQRSLPQSIQRCETCGCPSNWEAWETRSWGFCSPECESAFAESSGSRRRFGIR